MTDITVITSTLNSSQWLQRCIDSVLCQTHTSLQHVLVDGGSTDGTIDILQSQIDPRVDVLLGRDSGVYEAWNKGIRAATGDWILFLGSDDFVLEPDVFERVMETLRAQSGERLFAYGNLLNGPVDGHGTADRFGYWDPLDDRWIGPMKSFPPHPATFHTRDLYGSQSPYDESYRYSADAKFFFQHATNASVIYLGFDIVWFSKGGLTNRNGNQLSRWVENNRLRRELKFPFRPYTLFRSFASAIKNDFFS